MSQSYTGMPLWHRDDPETSVEAAQKHVATGARGRNCEIVLRYVRAFPGCTSGELSAEVQMRAAECHRLREEFQQIFPGEPYPMVPRIDSIDLAEVRRRITDLKQSGRIMSNGTRKCRAMGSSQQTYIATEV